MAWLFVSVAARLLQIVTNNHDYRLQIARGDRENWCEATFFCDAIISKLNHHGLGW